jgi:hypothetical protein
MKMETAHTVLDAARDGRVETMRELITTGADVNSKDPCGKTALMLASCRGHKEIVTVLITAGADANARDDNGNTALIYATYYTQLAPSSRWGAIVKALLSAGADPTVEGGYKQMSALMWAKELKQNDILALLEAAAEHHRSPKPSR